MHFLHELVELLGSHCRHGAFLAWLVVEHWARLVRLLLACLESRRGNIEILATWVRSLDIHLWLTILLHTKLIGILVCQLQVKLMHHSILLSWLCVGLRVLLKPSGASKSIGCFTEGRLVHHPISQGGRRWPRLRSISTNWGLPLHLLLLGIGYQSSKWEFLSFSQLLIQVANCVVIWLKC